MSEVEIVARLAGLPTQMCVFSLAHLGKGPVAVPIAYVRREGRFYPQPAPESRHGRPAIKCGVSLLYNEARQGA